MKQGVLLSACLLAALTGCGGVGSGVQTQNTLGGTVSGLNGTLVLQNNGSDDLTISTDGGFVFSGLISVGGSYSVTVLSQPQGDACTVVNASGSAMADVTDLLVNCRLESPALPNLSYNTKAFQLTWAAVAEATYYRLFENPDGVSGYSQIGADITGLGHDFSVALWQRGNASYVLQACDRRGCSADSAPVFVSGSLAEAVGYLKSTNNGTLFDFGSSLALSADGSTLAAGEEGAVQVFSRAGNTWQPQAVVQSSSLSLEDEFGAALALSADGNTLVVGAAREDSNATGVGGNEGDNSASSAGAVYVFTRSGNTWTQQIYLKASRTEADDRFGSALALSSDGNTLAVGAVGEDSSATGIGANQADNNAQGAGAVYLFTRSGISWSQQAYIKASNTDAGDSFGSALALSADGDMLAVGAIGESSGAVGIGGDETSGAALAAGAVYLFSRSGNSWSQQAYVKASNTDGGDRFGIALALSADAETLAVGANVEGSVASGINGDQFDNNASGAGAVYLFARSGSGWTQRSYLKASNAEAADGFGASLALSADGGYLVVGASGEDGRGLGVGGDQTDNSASSAGAVYVFSGASGSWSQQAYLKASNTEAGDSFGNAVALSADGDTLAVSAVREASNATDFGGNQQDNSTPAAGAVYIY